MRWPGGPPRASCVIGTWRFLTLQCLHTGLITVQQWLGQRRLMHQIDQRRDFLGPIVFITAHGGGARIQRQATAALARRRRAVDELAVVIAANSEGAAILLGNSCAGSGAIFTPS
jgi:hypothetical protein